MIDKQGLIEFVRQRGLAVMATCNHEGGPPEAALIGIASTDDGELVFDTSRQSRKCRNIQKSAKVALVIGWDEVTIQAEGIAQVLSSQERERYLPYYLAQFPNGEGRLKDPDIVHVVVRLSWLKYCDYRPHSFEISELSL